MKTTKKLLAALLAALLTLSPAGCGKDNALNIPANQTGSEDFQKNLHQSDKGSFLETDTGYYFTYGNLYFIAKDTKTATIVCAKPDCDHTDDSICNARIHADYLLTGGETLYYVGYVNGSTQPKLVHSMKNDATDRQTVQELKYNETSTSRSSKDTAIYHRGYIYYISDDILYRVKLGGEKDSAEIIWSPENAGTTQSYGGMVQFNPNAIRYTLWAEGDTLYFMANIQSNDGTYKDVLFQCDLSDLSVKQIWATPGADEVGEWETTGVSVSQWYVTNGTIYFYLSGGDMWRAELATGELTKLADTHEQTKYGSAIFSDEYMALLNDMPTDSYGNFALGGIFRTNADTIYLYGLDGSFIKEISLKKLLADLSGGLEIDLLMCDSTDIYFLTTGYTYDDPNSPTHATGRAITLCRANIETGEVLKLYKLQ